MNKNLALKILLLIGIIIVTANKAAFAACSSSASQTVAGSLPQLKQVVANGGNISATINETTGDLSAALTPAFRLTTNTSAPINVRMTSTCNTTTIVQNAFSGDGGVGTTFLILTNNTVLPTIAAVDDAKGAAVPAQNANVIAYAITPTALVPAELSYTWDNANQYYNGVLTHKGGTDTLLTTQTAPKAGTFSIADVDGVYQATIILSFV